MCVNNLAISPFRQVRRYDNRSEPRIVNCDCPGRRTVKAMERKPVPPDRRAPFDYNQSTARDGW